MRRGKLVYDCAAGYARVESRAPLERNTIHRMYSMSKPITSAALLRLVEQGKLQLSDPLHLHLGAKWKKKNLGVFRIGSYDKATKSFETDACRRTITVKHVLTHTSGLSYGFDAAGVANKVDRIYAERLSPAAKGRNLASFVDCLADQPLVFEPGTAWLYGFNTDVVGRLVEVISGQSLEEYLQEHILGPLKMVDTSFAVPPAKRGRFADVYMRKGQAAGMLALGASGGADRGLHNITEAEWQLGDYLKDASDPSFMMSGGGGLVGTVPDYLRFAQCMANGGELGGARILSRKTVEWMATNQLGRDGGGGVERDMAMMPPPSEGGYSEALAASGTGFGLGFSIDLRPDLLPYMTSAGAFGWGGAASTVFWVDPKEELVCVFATQFRFRDDFELPLKATLCNLVYGCVVDGDAGGGGRSRM